MILIIDDLRHLKPEVANKLQHEGRTVIVARNSASGIAELQENKGISYEAIYLDHDLGEVNGVVDSIMPVVDYLCEMAFNDTPVIVDTIYVHTSNPVGGKQMMLSLQRYGYNVKRIAPETIFTA